MFVSPLSSEGQSEPGGVGGDKPSRFIPTAPMAERSNLHPKRGSRSAMWPWVPLRQTSIVSWRMGGVQSGCLHNNPYRNPYHPYPVQCTFQ